LQSRDVERQAMTSTIDMAREVKMPYDFVTGEPINIEKLKAFEALVRADEREACADVVESTPWSDWFRTDCAIAIRNRGNI
jgi:phage anti-repressor protein